jgi:hypothetical protein
MAFLFRVAVVFDGGGAIFAIMDEDEDDEDDEDDVNKGIGGDWRCLTCCAATDNRLFARPFSFPLRS